jgi:hypothetical protein
MLYLRRHADRQAGPPAVVSMSFEKVPVGDVALSCVEEKEERERERAKGWALITRFVVKKIAGLTSFVD